jgi:hypothetical protein
MAASIRLRSTLAAFAATSPLALAAVLALGACGPSKAGQCADLVGVINRGVTALAEGHKQQTNDPTGTVELRAMAASMDKVAEELHGLKLDLPELRDFAGKYEKLAKDAAESARAVADAADKKDKPGVQKAQDKLAQVVRQEDGIIEGLNGFCSR